MSILCKILEKDEAIPGDRLVIGLPDENGQVVTIVNADDDDLDALKKGQQYSLAFVPFVPANHPAADVSSSPTATAETLVPAGHPVVLDAIDAASSRSALPTTDAAATVDPPAADAAQTAPPVDAPVCQEVQNQGS